MPLGVAVTVLAAGFALVAVGGAPFAQDVCSLDGRPEGTSVGSDVTLRPPGATECSYAGPGGEVTATTEVPWRDWTAVLLLATACGLSVAALRAGSRRRTAAAGAAGLVVLAFAVAFGLLA